MNILCAIGCHCWSSHPENFKTRLCAKCALTQFRGMRNWVNTGYDRAALESAKREQGLTENLPKHLAQAGKEPKQ